jgi:D-glycero-alpha-D-manno-heptose 1-phosphate guanylyltransferase
MRPWDTRSIHNQNTGDHGSILMTAIILVGGEGRRIGHLVPHVPKPLIEVAGKPFLHWVVRWLELQGERKIVLAAHHGADLVAAWADITARSSDLCIAVCREPQPLGTGGAVIHAAAHWSDDAYIVLNGDSLILAAIKPAFEWFCRSPGLHGVIIGVKVPDTARFGSIAADANGFFSGFFEKRPGAGLINAGVYFFRRELLNLPNAGRLSMEYELLPRWIKQGARIAVAVSKAPFIDIGIPETLHAGPHFILRNRAAFDDAAKLAPLSIRAME